MRQVRDKNIYLDELKSPGQDGSCARVMKELEDVISEPLNKIFQSFWSAGELPDDWKRAHVVQIFKKEAKKEKKRKRIQEITDQ